MEKLELLFDADPTDCGTSGPCPKFVLDEQAKKVFLIDKKGQKAEMTLEHFNKFVDAVLSGDLKKV